MDSTNVTYYCNVSRQNVITFLPYNIEVCGAREEQVRKGEQTVTSLQFNESVFYEQDVHWK